MWDLTNFNRPEADNQEHLVRHNTGTYIILYIWRDYAILIKYKSLFFLVLGTFLVYLVFYNLEDKILVKVPFLQLKYFFKTNILCYA